MKSRSTQLLRLLPLRFWKHLSNAAGTWNAILFVPILPSLCCADEASALRVLKSLGGNAVADRQRPDRPVIKVLLRGPKIKDEAIESVVELKSLESLDLGQTKVTDAGLKTLSTLTSLKQLSLDFCPITDVGVLELVRLTNLESLDLRRTSITSAGLSNLISLPRLRSLQITNFSGGVNLREISKLTNLQQLTIEGVLFRSIDTAGLSELKNLTNLKSLKLTFWPESALIRE